MSVSTSESLTQPAASKPAAVHVGDGTTKEPHQGATYPPYAEATLSIPPGLTGPPSVCNGIPWISFEYTRDRVKLEYTIRCDVDSVNIRDLSPEFRTENCVYPDAFSPKDEHRGSRFLYENECNTIGWALAQLNPSMRGHKGLIQRAVDHWRNSVRDKRLRYRRLRRITRKTINPSQEKPAEVTGPSRTSIQTISPGTNMHISLVGYELLDTNRELPHNYCGPYGNLNGHCIGGTPLPPISESPSPERMAFTARESPGLLASPQPHNIALANFLDMADYPLRGMRPRSVSYDAASSRASTVNSPMWEAEDSADTASEISFQSTSLPIRPHPNFVITNEGANYQCSVKGCGKLFTRNHDFRSHAATHREEEIPSYHCKQDSHEKRYGSMEHVFPRQQSAHAPPEQSTCVDCGLFFPDQAALLRHAEECCYGDQDDEMEDYDLETDVQSWSSDTMRSRTPSPPPPGFYDEASEKAQLERLAEHVEPVAPKSPGFSSSSGVSESSSSEDEGNLLSRAEQKKILLDRLMVFFYSIFSSRSPGPFTQATQVDMETTPSSSNADATDQITPGPNPRRQAVRRSGGRKRPSDGSDEDDEHGSRELKQRRISDQAGEPSRRLACPYFKKNPQCYQLWRSCPGPGWGTVHRVKEHLYRCHALPISCPRCHETFDNERLRDEHVRADEPCQKRQQEQLDGFDSTQRELLRSRKKVQKNMTEAEKWRDVYLILFPETETADVPSPYYDYPGTAESELHSSPTSEFARYEQFLRRELPSRVRQQLEVRIEEALNPVEETLRGQIVDIVRDMQLQLFEMYKSSRTTEAEGAEATAVGESAVLVDARQDVMETETSVQSWTLEEQLEAFRPPVPYFDGAMTGLDGILFDFDQLQPHDFVPDSGYGSLPSLEPDDKNEGVD